MRQQPFASPEEALAHYGVKGMRWGVRNEDDESSGRSAALRNEIEKGDSPKTVSAKKQTDSPQKTGGLSPTQKKAIFAAGVGVVAVGGFVAYKHYAGGSGPKLPPGDLTDWGNPMPKRVDMSALRTQRLSKRPLGATADHPMFPLYRRENLTLDISKGYADWLPKGGFANEEVEARHASVVRAVEAMREKYPAIRNMNIEIAPLSHADYRGDAGPVGLAQQLGIGEARVYYNDVKGAVTGDHLKTFIPGFSDPDHLGTHEMGHILSGAHGSLFSTEDRTHRLAQAAKKLKDHEMADDLRQAESKFHKDLFKKYGMSFEQLSKLGGYAASDPVEALAELSANFHSPGLRAKMDPELAKKAEAMFNEMGGLS